jgi:hypothetical protein
MSKKNIKLIAVLAILTVALWVWQGPAKKWMEKRSSPKNIFSSIDTAKVDKLSIGKAGKITVLVRDGEKIKIEGSKAFYVRPDIVSMIWDELNKAKSANLEVVSTNKDKAPEFGLDEGQGLRVVLSSGSATTSEFIIGRVGPDYESAYVKSPVSNESYLVKANLDSVFNRDEWRDMTIFSADREKISKLRFQFSNREFTIEKKDGKWKGTIPTPFEVKSEKLDEILAIMSNLTAQEIPSQDFKAAGFGKGGIIVQATGDGIDNTLMLGRDNGKGRVYAKNGVTDNIYLINSDQKKSLDKKKEDFK